MEELHARELYWGKVLNFGSTGLPRFDGKNFYQASPVKKSSSDSMRLTE